MGSMAAAEDVSCGCGPSSVPVPVKSDERPGYRLCSYVDGFMDTNIGNVPVIKTRLGFDDLFSTFYVRLGIRRYHYKVAPGIYAVGSPDSASEVLVTGNFKLTFDTLRKELAGISAWILVLDTRGINVWCAAGKGTFGTDELVFRIRESRLAELVRHQRLILPQLGAVGVSAKKVKERSGFRVVYGPVRAGDIKAFLKNRKQADQKMRTVTFTTYERFILTPIEIQSALKPAFISALVLLTVSGFGPGIFSVSSAFERGWLGIQAMIAGILAGAVAAPILLPWIPVRQFALKGILTGMVSAFILLMMLSDSVLGLSGSAALFLLVVSISSYTAMNFTGATPFTSPSGVEKEMKRFIPVQLAGIVISSGLWIYNAFKVMEG